MIILKPKLLFYPSINVANVFAKETDVLTQLQQGKLNEALILWQPDEPTLVLPSGNKWQASEALNEQLIGQPNLNKLLQLQQVIVDFELKSLERNDA